MKFMVMHKHDQKTEAGEPPPMELIQGMGALVGGMAQSGKLLDGDGLGPTKGRSRLRFRGGERTVEHGPFGGSNELPAGFAKITVASRDEAIGIATRIGEAIGGDLEIEVGKLTEAWDLGFGEKPVDAPERYLVVHKATAASEAGQVASYAVIADELREKGILTNAAVLAPSSRAKRLTWQRDAQQVAHHVTDGPFAESKELIGGYAILEMASMDECLAFTREYAQLLLTNHDTLEIDIRPL